MRICSKCKVEKDLTCFSKMKGSRDGHRPACKECVKVQDRSYYDANKDKILARNKRYCEHGYNWVASNREKRREWERCWYEKNKDAISDRRRVWRGSNGHRLNEYRRRVYSNPYNRMVQSLRSRVKSALNGCNKCASTMDLIGCDAEYLREHIESQFTDGMSWENYGYYGWHIDHWKPCASFDLTDPEKQRECFHYTNLQPLWASDNLSKGARVI